MFLGQYRHTFDEKYRLTIPARFRELLVDGAYIVQGFDRNLMVFTLEMFEKISQRLNRMNMTDPSVRQLKRLLYSSADRVDPDRAGRILVPQFLREVAMLESEAVIVGIGDYFEIWSPEMWQEQETVLKDSSANSQRFAAFDLSGE